MTSQRKPSETREKELRLALARIQRGRARTGETKVTIAAVAREAGVSAALIHNHYPKIAEKVREAQGLASRVQRDVKIKELRKEQQKNRTLRQQIQDLGAKLARLVSINEVLIIENQILQAESNKPKTSSLAAKTPKKC